MTPLLPQIAGWPGQHQVPHWGLSGASKGQVNSMPWLVWYLPPCCMTLGQGPCHAKRPLPPQTCLTLFLVSVLCDLAVLWAPI